MAEAARLGVPAWLLELLRCPLPHHAPLILADNADGLVCSECGRTYPVSDGLPIMLVVGAEDPEPGR